MYICIYMYIYIQCVYIYMPMYFCDYVVLYVAFICNFAEPD